MRKSFAVFVVLSVTLCAGELEYFPLKNVHAGLKGKGKTCLNGTDIVEFDVEVLDVLPKVFPKLDIILARLSGAGLEKTGIIAGMSGSPVYVDGKLLGAVAYGWYFNKEPICGLTPFEQMLELKTIPAPPQPMLELPNFEQLLKRMIQPRQPRRVEEGLRKLSIPLNIAGATSWTRQFVERVLKPEDFETAGAGAKLRAQDVPFEPGSPVAIQLLSGDMLWDGIGTVTAVSGKKVYAFGHPIFGWGKMEVPMATARVHAVIPSVIKAFKVASSVKRIGAFTFDSGVGTLGEIGRMPRMLPIDIKAFGKSYHFESIDNQQITPILVAISILESVMREGLPGAETTLLGLLEIEYGEGEKAQIPLVSPMVTSDFFTLVVDLVFPVWDALGSLYRNTVEKFKPRGFSIKLGWKKGVWIARIERIRIEKLHYEPGEEITVRVLLKRFRKPTVEKELTVKIPQDFPEGRAVLSVCDSWSSIRMERAEKPHRFRPASIEDILSVLQESAQRNKLIVRLSSRVKGLAGEGVELERLPLSVLSVLNSRTQSGTIFSRTRLKRSFETEYAVYGTRRLSIEVRRHKEKSPW